MIGPFGQFLEMCPLELHWKQVKSPLPSPQMCRRGCVYGLRSDTNLSWRAGFAASAPVAPPLLSGGNWAAQLLVPSPTLSSGPLALSLLLSLASGLLRDSPLPVHPSGQSQPL